MADNVQRWCCCCFTTRTPLHFHPHDKLYPIPPTCHPVLYNISLLLLLRGPTNHTHVLSLLFSGVVVGVRCRVRHDGGVMAPRPRATQILANRKSVSVWHREFSKIVERRTFKLINYARKYVKLDKMDKSTTLDNLGHPRTPQ